MSRKSRKKNRKPKTIAVPSNSKLPSSQVKQNDYKKNKPVWKVRSIDDESPWGWKSIGIDNWEGHIFPALQSFETMTWGAIESAPKGRGKGTKHHFIDKERLISVAQERLERMKLDDIEQVFSLRLSGKKRIFGILENNVFKILWFDMEHEICPSSK